MEQKVESFKDYLARIYKARYFWYHLAKMDLKNRFRRSKLGILWVCVNPLCLTFIMTFVFGAVFREEVWTYAPYILSGLLFWNIVTDALVAGWSSISGNEPYIRQYNHPVVIYPLEKSIASIISFVISTVSLAVIRLFSNPFHVVVGYIALPIALVIYFILSWSGTIISSYIGTKYRDYPQLISLFLQAVWYVSPVFMQERIFFSNEYLYKLYIINPITHLLKLIREPFLYGRFASWESYLISIGTTVCFAVIAFVINKKNERDIIFYI